MRRKTKKRRLATPDLTPLIDVVFLLLIFFMLVTTFDKYSSFKLELPKVSIESTTTEDVDEIIIDSTGEKYFKHKNNSEKITLEEFPEKLKGINQIIITADRKLPYEKVIGVIEELKKVGVEKVELNLDE